MFPKVNISSSLNDLLSEFNVSLFDVGHNENNRSAIDSFILKNIELNKLIIDPTGKLGIINQMILDGEINELDGRKVLATLSTPHPSPKFLNLVLLGYVSSVEAFIRKLIRDIINIDPYARMACSRESVEFGSTYFQEPHVQPESLMSHTNFIHSSTIVSECSKLLGISSQKIKLNSIERTFSEYNSLCQLRHCIVHRFGHIGVNNLMTLDMHSESFKSCIEKPISLDFNTIQKVSKTTVNLAREVNNALWTAIMERLRDSDPATFTWDLRTDKKLFKKYLKIFYESSLGDINAKLTDIYNAYRETK